MKDELGLQFYPFPDSKLIYDSGFNAQVSGVRLQVSGQFSSFSVGRASVPANLRSGRHGGRPWPLHRPAAGLKPETLYQHLI